MNSGIISISKFGLADSWHTRGFYERAGGLYHHAVGTPLKKLFVKHPWPSSRVSPSEWRCCDHRPHINRIVREKKVVRDAHTMTA
jgi:hypothetical protein